ncbi:MAG: hypothetical protein RL271_1044 [Actinomycetota bacterium]
MNALTPARVRRNLIRLSRISLSILQISTTLIAISAITAAPANAACATDFPTVGWQAIRTTSGATLTDTTSEFSPYTASKDLSSVNGSAMDWFSSGSGCDFFFRLRLKGNPVQGTGLDNNVYLVAIGRGTSPIVWTGINGDGTNKPSTVYVYNPTTSTYLSQVSVSGSDGTSKIKMVTDTVGATTEYLLEWRVANSLLPAGAFTSPVGFFAGTSQSNAITTINADCIDALTSTGLANGSCTPTYTGTLAADLTLNTDAAVRPNITSVTPNKGTSAGGTTVSISGTNLSNTSQVYFGGTAATITS